MAYIAVVKLKLTKPIDSLSKAYFKQTVTDGELEAFTINVKNLLDNFNDKETEEHNKNLVRDFLLKTYYHDKYAINTKGKDDLVIHHDKKTDSALAVIIETKKRGNNGEMISAARPNAKALHELIFYYLKERYTHDENSIKNLIATNGYEWYIFDEVWFEKNIFRDVGLKKAYLEFSASGNDTKHFYDNIASVFLKNYDDEIPCTYVNLEEIFKGRQPGKKEVKALYKLFAPEHLLKKPFANDSNQLNKDFYYELLYILGLEEKKDGSKKLIDRPEAKARIEGSIIENTINKLQTGGRWKNVSNLSSYGENVEKQIFSIALELSISWLNRVLFLKLLEGQLIRYQATAKAKNEKVAFLNTESIADYTELNELFFDVLAVPVAQRPASVTAKFGNIPYLNSSLFETSELESATFDISGLKGRLLMPLLKSTILKDNTQTKTGSLHTLEYLFKFLDAYDFSSDENDEIQRNNKPIINAAVLGLIFEKINGYKDGSFFTPSFITMYMSRVSLRRAVVQKFNDTYTWKCETLNDVFNQMDKKDISIKKANEVVNSLKICDPAVGSGHFLVSALNELIAIKEDLKILVDKTGKRISGYSITIERDELLLMRDYEFFSYNYTNPESQRVQETLFHEKQALIENCLFGVDINPKSVMICRLRLWVELLKNAYYTTGKNRELQTLPNIDINIKCGNSLISRFTLDEDLSEVFRKQKFTRQTYLLAVDSYKNARSKGEKEELRKFIQTIKDNFKATVFNRNPYVTKLSDKRGELVALDHIDLFGKRKLTDEQIELTKRRLKKEIAALDIQLEEYKSSVIYRDAFEWRFEFPEVLNDEGYFVGFDVVIGNPPYIRHEEIKTQKQFLQTHYTTYSGTADLYVYFVEKAFKLLKKGGGFCYIMPNKWMQTEYGKPLRIFFLENRLHNIIDFGDLQVFDEATTYPCILSASKLPSGNTYTASLIQSLEFDTDFWNYTNSISIEKFIAELSDETWIISSDSEQKIMSKLKALSIPLKEYVGSSSYRGILTGLTEAFLIDDETKRRIIREDPKSKELIKPFLLGRNIKPYAVPTSKNWLILIPKGFTIKKNLPKSDIHYVNEPPPRYGNMVYSEAWIWFKENYPGVARHLAPYREKAEERTDKGDYWWELRACDYYEQFETPKIMYQVLQVKPCFIYDENGYYCNNSMWIIPKADKYLVAILNSKMGWWLISKYCSAIQNGYQLIWKYFGQIPIPNATKKQQLLFITFVDQILTAKKVNPEAETKALEEKIDKLVFDLYGLEDEERKIVMQR
jgi:hypothetical protein